jgi:hypothetical protein
VRREGGRNVRGRNVRGREEGRRGRRGRKRGEGGACVGSMGKGEGVEG